MDNVIFNIPLAELRQRGSQKWTHYPAEVLPAWVAEMDCRPPQRVTEVITRAMSLGDTGYSEGDWYAETLQTYAKRRWQWDFDAATQAVGLPSVMHGIVHTLDHFVRPGSGVVINPPVYAAFFSFLKLGQYEIIENDLTPEGRIDLATLADTFAGKSGSKPAAYLLCNPHNPHGTVHTREELAAVAAVADEHDVLVISDEIHGPLVDASATFVPYLDVAGTENGITITSASKAYNLPGMPAAVAVAGVNAAERLQTMSPAVTHAPSYFGILAQQAAWDHGDAWLTQLNLELEQNRQHLAARLAAELPTVSYTPNKSTYLAWVDCTATGVANPFQACLDQGLALTPGRAFSKRAPQFARVNLGTSLEILDLVIDKMVAALG
ncbi:MalY/PatB family protein [Granulicoccus phenolivorans]|uniref:MalY/PatB family protein n=1 Tax=Granulicoccus phenolivorans TaxID=266854 RepID=UPI000403D1BF|nr:aminotransferase class I/II-fold pyridoxal phosphate-dependent enzyme [Granulicoccus phenolivorans]